MYSSTDKQIIKVISQDVVIEIAKNELILFPQICKEYFQNSERTLKPRPEREVPTEFGGTELVLLLTPIILEITKDVIKDIIEDPIKDFLKDRITHTGGKLFNKLLIILKRIFRKSEVEVKAELVKPEFTSAQIAHIHQYAFEKACELNVDAEKASLLADSIVNSLVARSK